MLLNTGIMKTNINPVGICMGLIFTLTAAQMSANQTYVEEDDYVSIFYNGEDKCQYWGCNDEANVIWRCTFSGCKLMTGIGGCCKGVMDVKNIQGRCLELQLQYKETNEWFCEMPDVVTRYWMTLLPFDRSEVIFDEFNGFLYENISEEITCMATAIGAPPSSRIDIVLAEENITSCNTDATNNFCRTDIVVDRSYNAKPLTCYSYQTHDKNMSSVQVDLNVTYAPSDIKIEQDGIHLLGTDSQFTCVVQTPGNPDTGYHYTWFTNDSTALNCGNSTSEISCKINSDCTSSLKCEISNIGGTDSGTVIISVDAKTVLLQNSSIHTVFYEDDLQFVCAAYAKPRPNVTWDLGQDSYNDYFTTKAQNDSQDGSCKTLIIVSSELIWKESDVNKRKSTNGWNITCLAGNTYNDDVSLTLTLNVTYPPENAQISYVGKATVGESIILKCELGEYGNPSTLSYYWETTTNGLDLERDCNSTKGPVVNCTILTACSFVISCVASNSYGNASSTHNITIFERSTIVSPVNNSHYDVCYDSSELPIICSAYGKPKPDVAWHVEQFNGSLDQEDSNQGQYNCSEYFTKQLLWGSNVEGRKHIVDSKIVCEASNSEGSSTVSFILNTEYPPGKPQIAINMAPLTLTLTPQQLIVEVNQKATFSCNLQEHGNPQATDYSFLHNNTEICPETNGETCQVDISNIAQEGLYLCQASNNPISPCQNLSVESDSVNLTVYVPVEFIFIPENVHPVYEDPSFTIRCEAIGKPTPIFRLLKDGIEVNNGFTYISFKYPNDTKYGLQEVHVTNYAWNDFEDFPTCETIVAYDSEKYSCQIENLAADGSTHINQSSLFSFKTQYQPLWNDSVSTKVLAEMYQELLTITCDMCAYPELVNGSFTWRNESHDIIPNEKSSSLVITNVTQFTNVTCEADNGIGHTTQVINISESGPPRIEIIRVLGTTSISITIEWEARDGNNPPLFMDVYSRMNEDNSNSTYKLYSSATSCDDIHNETIMNLTSTTHYEILVYIENGYRKTNYTEQTTNATTRDSPNVNYTGSTLTQGWITATWRYDNIELMKIMKINHESIEYRVEVRVIYWDPATNVKFWNPKLHENPIPASQEYHRFKDASVTENFLVAIEVYENGILNHNLQSEGSEIEIETVPGTSVVGAIVGSVFVAVLSALAVLGFVYRERIKDQFNRRPDDEIEIHSQQGIQHDDQNTASTENLTAVAPVYPEVKQKKDKFASRPAPQDRNATDKTTNASKGFSNPLYQEFRNPVPLKPKPRREDLPDTRYMDENGCIFIKNEAIYFPNSRSSPDGKPSPIICLEDRVEYSTIDFSILPESPPPDSEEEKENEEEDVMGTLPDRRPGDGKDCGEDDDEDLW